MKIINNKKNEIKKSKSKVKMGWIESFKLLMIKPKQRLLINMKLINGDKEQFIAKIENNAFKYLNAKYVVDEECMTFNRTFKMYESDYHQNLSIPIRQEIECNEIVQELKNQTEAPYYDIINNINPITLKEFVDSKIIQNSLQGQAMTQIFGFIKVMLVIVTIISGISLLIMINVSGIFA